MRLVYIFMMTLIMLTACKSTDMTTRQIDMYNSDGDMVGTATFIEQANGVEVKVKVDGLDPGFHGAHIHEFPVCEGPDFKRAGNHLNPKNTKHGLMHPEGAHLGDLPNIEADASGQAEDSLFVDEATLLDGGNSLLKDGGASFIITADPDDGISQPSGNSGQRILCGVINNEQQDKQNDSPTDPTETEDQEEESS